MKNLFRFNVIMLIGLLSAASQVSASSLPLVGVCNMQAGGLCIEFYSNRPENGASCGLNDNGRCPQGAEYIGTCSSLPVSTVGVDFQTQTSYYTPLWTMDLVTQTCSQSGGHFTPTNP